MKIYTGLKLPKKLSEKGFIHVPLIKIVPRPEHDEIRANFNAATHLIFTSRTAVFLFCDGRSLKGKTVISVGTSTTKALQKHGVESVYTAQDKRAEGVVDLLHEFLDSESFFLWPHSASARSLISDFLREMNQQFYDFSLYDVEINENQELPSLQSISEVYFTSPSTVDAFIRLYGTIPSTVLLHAIGSVTQEYIDQFTLQIPIR